MSCIGREQRSLDGIAVLVAALLFFSWSSAATASLQGSSKQIVAMLVPADQEDQLGQIVHAVDSQLSDCNVALRLMRVQNLGETLETQVAVAERVSLETGALAVFWCDLVTNGEMYLYLSEEAGKRILVRKLEKTEERGRAEGLAIIVRSSVLALMQGGKIGVEVEQAVVPQKTDQHETARPTPNPPSKSPRVIEERVSPATGSTRFALQVAYAFQSVSEDHYAQHGLDLAIDVRVHPHLSLLAGYTIFGAAEKNVDSVDVRFYRHPARLGVRAHIDLGAVELGGALALLADFATQKISVSRIDPTQMDIASDKNDLFFSLLPSLEIIVPIIDRMSFFFAAAAEVQLNSRRYVAEMSGQKRVLLDSWPVQPWIVAGLWAKLF